MILDLIKSYSDNMNERIKNPIIGAFIGSWVLCNWEKLALFFWSSSAFEKRVYELSSALNNSLANTLWYPLLFTLLYIFILPLLELGTQQLIKFIDIKKHKLSVHINEEKQRQRNSLNKAIFKANPDNGYIKRELDLDFEKEIALQKKLEQEQIQQEAKTEQALIEKEKSALQLKIETDKEKQQSIELEKSIRNNQRDKEKREFELEKIKGQQSTVRFPAVYVFLEKLSLELKNDEIKISLQALSKITSTIFGYNSFQEILNDKSFNADTISNLKYIVYNSRRAITELESIIENEGAEDIYATSIFDYVSEVLKYFSIKLIEEESLAEEILNEINASNNILLSDELSGAMAETNAFFDEEPELEIDEYKFNEDRTEFIITFNGSCSGTQNEDKMWSGNMIDVNIIASLPVLIGRNGLAEHQLTINANVSHPDD